MLEKFRELYKEKLWVKIVTVTLVVFLSVAVMIPVVKISELFGIKVSEVTGLNFKVTFGLVFTFLLIGTFTTTVIWLAQKYIHQKTLAELGLFRKFWIPSLIGFVIGVIIFSIRYVILYVNGVDITFTKVDFEDVSMITYIGYYLYFFIGFIFWNSFIEEIGMRAYPIQKLKNYINPHIIFTIMGIIFTAFHFVTHEFNLVYCLSLFLNSYIFSLVYYYSNSFWLTVGIHSGNNWTAFSFFGNDNWKLGGLYNIKVPYDPSWINNYAYLIVLVAIIFFIVFLNKKGLFRKYYPQ